jgi:ppGpp synthetase/RelA/SpoT-type nucleotidyltranferase
MSNEIQEVREVQPEAAPAFDFDRHRARAIEQYHGVRPTYEDFCETIKRVLADALRSYRAGIHSIAARAKDPESFGQKAAQPSTADPQCPKYAEPLRDITDLAGARIITYFLDTVTDISRIITWQFDVLEKADKTTLLKDEEFGYQSVHYLVRLKDNRTDLPEYVRFKGLTMEIQVRTILQHAWGSSMTFSISQPTSFLGRSAAGSKPLPACSNSPTESSKPSSTPTKPSRMPQNARYCATNNSPT